MEHVLGGALNINNGDTPCFSERTVSKLVVNPSSELVSSGKIRYIKTGPPILVGQRLGAIPFDVVYYLRRSKYEDTFEQDQSSGSGINEDTPRKVGEYLM